LISFFVTTTGPTKCTTQFNVCAQHETLRSSQYKQAMSCSLERQKS